ncbi:hypothetical protein L5515_004584 [Caenorhabditis briggsae]|uniref:Sdz-33 F-box domain-containing protein n=1 Tax=Caenorhabditis briggsae TaxID=6238 RepID=A0AAE9EKX0_CAEBR|nr:hypothetical protein L5515_004584 [Caenorhabditis briggsae]
MMNENPFPLHKFNVVELRAIFKNLSLDDIVQLSFTSDDIRNALGEVSLPISAVEIFYSPRKSSIKLKSEKGDILWTDRYPNTPMTFVGEIKIGRISLKCMKSGDGFHTRLTDIGQGVFTALTYFTDIFNFKNAAISELALDLSIVPDSRIVCSQFTAFTSIERLAVHESIRDEDAEKAFALNFGWIMKNLKPKEIYIGVEIMEPVLTKRRGRFDIHEMPRRFEQIFDLDHICVKYSEWITEKDFFNLNVKTAILMNSSLSETSINKFIKKWLESDFDRLNWMEVKLPDRNFQQEEILEGLDVEDDTYRLENTRCSCPFRRFETVESVPFEFPTASKKVTRDSDSTIATISIIRDTFFFHVRNDGPVTPPVPPPPPEQPEQLAQFEQGVVERIMRRDPDEDGREPDEDEFQVDEDGDEVDIFNFLQIQENERNDPMAFFHRHQAIRRLQRRRNQQN